MFNYKQIIITLILLVANLAYASSWLQADLYYQQSIDGKLYPAEVSLLRPESYFKQNNATESGAKLVVNLPEMGLENVSMRIIDIRRFKGIPLNNNGHIVYKQIDEINWDGKLNNPVTATFKRYAKEVYTYQFRNIKSGKITSINATPNHRFYVRNKQQFIAIDNVSPKDELITDDGSLAKLVCSNGQAAHCGKRYNKDDIPVQVYNIEVYPSHMYFAGNGFNILVHNVYCPDCGKLFSNTNSLSKHKSIIHNGPKRYLCDYPKCAYKTYNNFTLEKHRRTHTGEKPYRCSFNGCSYRASDPRAISIHEVIHTGARPYGCPHCKATFTQSSNANTHIRNSHLGMGGRHIKITPAATDVAGPSSSANVVDDFNHELERFIVNLDPDVAAELDTRAAPLFNPDIVPPEEAADFAAWLTRGNPGN